jgi:hypothetical protein
MVSTVTPVDAAPPPSAALVPSCALFGVSLGMAGGYSSEFESAMTLPRAAARY